jgi:hypothetical protein
MRDPSGDHAGSTAKPSVTRRSPEPSSFIAQSDHPSPNGRVLANTSCRLSGDQLGVASSERPLAGGLSLRCPLPSRFIDQIAWRPSSLRNVAKASRSPSGAHAGDWS